MNISKKQKCTACIGENHFNLVMVFQILQIFYSFHCNSNIQSNLSEVTFQGNIEIGSYEVGAVQNFILQMTINAHPLSILL